MLPPDRPGALPHRRGAEHLRQGGARAADDDARQRAHVRLHPGADRLRPRRRSPRSSARSRSCSPTSAFRATSSSSSTGRRATTTARRRRRSRAPASRCRRSTPTPRALGLLGAQPRPGPVHRPHALGPRQGQGVRRHRRLVRHRPGDGAQARRGRREGGDRRPRPGEARRDEAGDRGQGRHLLHLLVRPHRHGLDRRAGEAGPRRPRHRRLPRQQRRPLDPSRGTQLARPLPRLRAHDAAQLLRRGQADPRLPAEDGRAAARPHHQHQLDRRAVARAALLGLRRVEGGARRVHGVRGLRVPGQGHRTRRTSTCRWCARR